MLKTISRQPNYSDLNLDMIAHPTTGDVVKLTGVDAIKRSVRNLILTNFYDRPFRSYIGSNAQKLLFENVTPMTATFLSDAIREVITNFEPRVELINDEYKGVRVVFDPDQNGYVATISFIEVNRAEPVTITQFLSRIR